MYIESKLAPTQLICTINGGGQKHRNQNQNQNLRLVEEISETRICQQLT